MRCKILGLIRRSIRMSAAVAQTSVLLQDTTNTLTWRMLDPLERGLMLLCGICLAGFTATTMLDVLARIAGHPLLWPQEVTSAFFVYGVFIGAAVATRRNDHLYLSAMTDAMSGHMRQVFEVFNRAVVLSVGLALAVFGWQNFLTGLRQLPHALDAADRLPLLARSRFAALLVALFSLEQIVNGLSHGFTKVPGHMAGGPAGLACGAEQRHPRP